MKAGAEFPGYAQRGDQNGYLVSGGFKLFFPINVLVLAASGYGNAWIFFGLFSYFFFSALLLLLSKYCNLQQIVLASLLLELCAVFAFWLPVEWSWVLRGVGTKNMYLFGAWSTMAFALVGFTGIGRRELYLEWHFSRRLFIFVLSIITAFLVLVLATLPMTVGFVPKLGLNPKALEAPLYPLSLLRTFLLIWFAKALIEELIFRGLIQNILLDICKSRNVRPIIGIAAASIIFGFAHINNSFQINDVIFSKPAWQYVFYGTLAGFVYGGIYHKSQSLPAAILSHTIVDFAWGLFIAGVLR